jgi:hypothetical protein
VSPDVDPAAVEVEALQRALAAEHAAVYAYGVVGALAGDEARRDAMAAIDAHRARRDRLRVLIADRAATPVAAEPFYDLPEAVQTPEDARMLATTVEERLAAVWADVVAAVEPALREFAVLALQEAAVRAARWRGGSIPWPGLPERTGV